MLVRKENKICTEAENLEGDAKLLRSLSKRMDSVRNTLHDDVSTVIIQSLADAVRSLSTMNIKGGDDSKYDSAKYIFKKDLEKALNDIKKHYHK